MRFGWRPSIAERADGGDRLDELVALLADHREAGSALAARLLETADLAADVWLVEPVAASVATPVVTASDVPAEAGSQPDRNPAVPGPLPTAVARGGTVELNMGQRHLWVSERCRQTRPRPQPGR